MEDLAAGRFLPVLDDPDAIDRAGVRRVVLCSGKVFYDLRAGRRERNEQGVALVRCERLYPFPKDEILATLARYPAGAEVVWCQEEPRNMGPWPMYDEWLLDALPNDRRPRYVGRSPSASPAVGSYRRHLEEQAKLVSDALSP
jgi:2-oxoglutarate dehydrogenase E1 component